MKMGDPERARIHHCQGMLLPRSASELSKALGLNWLAAIKLYEDGWLSFDPKIAAVLEERQEHEMRFVGSLVAAGCDQQTLESLLEGLPRPYCYDLSKLYYDWAGRRWRLLPESPTDPAPDEVFDNWLAGLAEDRDVTRLEDLLAQVEGALKRARSSGGNT